MARSPVGQMGGLYAACREAFGTDLRSKPAVTLHAGAAIDLYLPVAPGDETYVAPTDEYLRKFAGGLAHLDAASWRHYLPYFLDFSLRHAAAHEAVVEDFLWNVRPPDRDPPRLGSLRADQSNAVEEVLRHLAFSADSAHQELACMVLQEWWSRRP